MTEDRNFDELPVPPVEVISKLRAHLQDQHFETFQRLDIDSPTGAAFLNRWHDWLHAHPDPAHMALHIH